jgi:hypothetical protein
MSSRSRRSSDGRTSRSIANTTADTPLDNKPSSQQVIIVSMILILYHLLVLGYIITLEGNKCNCINDWRHDFIKYYSGVMIIWGIVIILLTGTSYRHSMLVMILQNLLLLASFVNVLCLFTYIGDLDKTYCKCAIEKQKNMHYFLYLWRYVLVGVIILSLISIIIGSLVSK